ncbi:MAG: IS5 family transposase, partial [bacterium]|nr:IS5 family transposase [bacterium]
MEQTTFSELEHDMKKRRTRRELFLRKMDGLIPWSALESRIEPFYPKAGRGRRPYPLGVMLRVHCVQLFYNLSDPGTEDLLYEVESVRRFAGLRLTGPLPDETTILHFRHLLERHSLGSALFEEINAHLASLGHRLKTGTIVDASIIDAPSSTKNAKRERDPEMHQTKK